MFQTYFKIGWRNLIKNKIYSLINIGGLAIGMAVTLLVALWITDELNFNTYHKSYKSLAKVYRNNIREQGVETAYPMPTGLGTLLRNEYSSHFKSVVMVRQQMEDRVLAYGEQKVTVGGRFMQPEGVELFSLNMIKGSGARYLEGINSIIISESLSKKIFGNDGHLNKIIEMNGKEGLLVTGVYEDLPKTSELYGTDFFAPLDLFLGNKERLNVWDNYDMTVYVQLKENDPKKVSAIIRDAMLPHVHASDVSKPQLFLLPMSDWHLNAEFENGVPVTSKQKVILRSYATIGIFVLLLAVINFMNLSTARSEKRAKEVGVRKTLGSRRVQLIQQFLGESVLVAFLSFILALIIAQAVLPGFNQLSDKEVDIPFYSPLFWLLSLSVMLLTGFLAGSYPAFYLSSFNPVKVLKGNFKLGSGTIAPRNILVTVQFTISICLIIATAIVYQQIRFAKNRPVGYSREGLMSFRPRTPEFKGKFITLRNELKRTGMVEEIAEANYSINSTLGWNSGFSWKGHKINPSFNTISVSPEYGKTLRWQLLSGRDFSRERELDGRSIIINQTAQKTLGIQKPVGEKLHWKVGDNDLGDFEIIGVVEDMVKGSPFEASGPSIIFPVSWDMENLYLRINPNVSIHDALPKIREVFKQVVPAAPFDYTFADDDYLAKFKTEERIGDLAAAITVLALLISCLGLFGLIAFVAEQRTKEIGIRKVLGASVLNIWNMLSRDFIRLVVIACLIAIPLAYLAMKGWLQNYDYRMDLSPWVFLVAGLSAILIAFITASFQAIASGLANPVKSLRAE